MSTRNTSIDSIKLIASFFVVCIHVPINNSMGPYLIAISRFAVPLFFLISGYYYGSKPDNMSIKKQIIKIIKLVITANVLFALWRTLLLVNNGNSLFAIFAKLFSFKNLLIFFIFGESPFASHLWYLTSIAYVYGCFLIFNSCGVVRYIFLLIPLLLIGDLILGKYSLVLLNHEYPYIWVRNFIFVGIPYFSIGYLIKLKQEVVLKIVSPKILTTLIVLFIITTIAERFVLNHYSVNPLRDHYISTTFLTIAIFLLALSIPGFCFFPEIGRKHTTYLYIIHPIIHESASRASNVFHVSGFYRYTGPVVVFITTIGILSAFELYKSRSIKKTNVEVAS